MVREVLAATNRLVPSDLVLDLGPHHPGAHGALQLRLQVDGEGDDAAVVSAEPVVGFMHRGAEKLFEVRDYRQIAMLADRHDWLSAAASEVGLVMAVERLTGLEPPPRAVWLRTAFAELNRVANHLAFLGALPLEEGGTTPVPVAWRAREALLAVLEEATGARIHYGVNRVGGIEQDVPAGWTGRVGAALVACRAGLRELAALVDGHDVLLRRTRGIGVLTRADALAHGVSGVPARASGLDLDVRRDDPYLAYGDLELRVVVGTAGDAHERYRCLVEQSMVSLDLVEQCLERLPSGPVNVRLPKNLRAPVGTAHTWTENPLGVMGWFLVSRGDRVPWRLAMRTASFSNLSALPALLPGTRLRDLTAVLASVSYVVGDLEK